MRHPLHLSTLLLAALTPLLVSCAGTGSALIANSTNVGIDIDSTPPQAEISISRKEIAVQPGFEGGETLPAVMSFSTKHNTSFLAKLFTGITSTFATGRAASHLTSEEVSKPKEGEQAPNDLELSEIPAGTGEMAAFKNRHQLVGPGELRPLVFGTKTLFGLHVTWDPKTNLPADFKLGFNRKEAAYAPVGYRKKNGKVEVQVPSTIATLDNGTGVTKELQFGHTQYFATGRAAENLARKKEVQELFLKRVDPALAKAAEASEATPEAPGSGQ